MKKTSGLGYRRPPVTRADGGLSKQRFARLCVGICIGLAAVSQAQTPPPAPVKPRPLDYLHRLEAWGLEKTGRERDPQPDGKIVDEILVESEEIVAEDDPWPNVVNWVHVKTKPHIVERELRVRRGEVWDADRIAESERILRALGNTASVFATARIIPLKSGRPGHVSMLVVTKDLWSIRLNSSFSVVGTTLKQLRIRPTENNFLGRNKQLSLDFDLQQATLAVGQAYGDPRFLGSRLSLAESSAIIFNRQSQSAEGSRGRLDLGRPQYSLDDLWSAAVGGGWVVSRPRIFRGASIWQLPYPDATAPNTTIPFMYDARDVAIGASVTRSFGRRHRTNITGSISGYSRLFTPQPELGLTPEQSAWLTTRYLPRSENATYLGLTALTYEGDFRVYRNVRTFALPEDVRLGYRVIARARYAPPLLPKSSHFLEMGMGASYGWEWAQDLLFVSAGVAVRHVPGATGVGVKSPWVNQRAAFEISNVTPPLGYGRLVTRLMGDFRVNDIDNTLLILGGASGLRGSADGFQTGTQEILFNAEYRTLPIEILTVHFGLVFFWDAGAVYTAGPPNLTHTLGLGLRALIPQFDVEVFRLDLGFVLNGPNPAFPNRLSSSFGQITGLRPSLMDDPLN